MVAALVLMAVGGAGLMMTARGPAAARAAGLVERDGQAGQERAQAPAGAKAAPGAATSFEELPPEVRLGVRAASVQQQLAVHPTLVLVSDEAAYVAAIASWSTTDKGAVRFPVLIDRGRYEDQQRVARFVRAFKPSSVVRWKPGLEKGGALPADRRAKERVIEDAVVSAWGAGEIAKLKARWEAFKFTPAGMVVMWAEDPAWTGGLALAAGRGELIAWVQPRGGGAGNMAMEADAEAMSKDIDSALKTCGYPYAELGDAIDAITLSENAPPKVFLGDRDPRKMLALTDMIGRGKDGKRFAWCGQVLGDSAEAAYMAMCSLFLPAPSRAWLFDGYPDNKPWSLFDAGEAAEKLRNSAMSAVVDNPAGGGSLDEWRARIAGKAGRFDRDALADSTEAAGWGFGVDAQLISVTTSGNPDFFELKPGFGHSVDVPILRTPSVVEFVHSWSANNPRERSHISSVWLERGAFGYVGSVHEPFLSAFVPTPILMTRLTAGLPWGVAPRIDKAEVWKVAVFGDPLYTVIVKGAPKAEGALPLSGAQDVGESVAGLLKDKKYVEAIRALSIVGRDRDAARLLWTLLKDGSAKNGRELALSGIGAAYAAGDMETLLAAAKVILPETPTRVDGPEAAAVAEVRDMVWHVVWANRATLGAEGARLLYRAMRPENLVADAKDLVSAVQAGRVDGLEPRQIVVAAEKMTDDRGVIEALEKVGK